MGSLYAAQSVDKNTQVLAAIAAMQAQQMAQDGPIPSGPSRTTKERLHPGVHQYLRSHPTAPTPGIKEEEFPCAEKSVLCHSLLFSPAGPTHTLTPTVASMLVKGYLKPYAISGMTLESLTNAQPPLPRAYLAVVTFPLSFGDGATMPFKGQPVYITFNEVTRAFEVDREFTSVAKSIEETICPSQHGHLPQEPPLQSDPGTSHRQPP